MTITRNTATALTATALALTAVVLPAATADAKGVPACGNHALKVGASREDGATGHADFVLTFRNTSKATCSIHGYPGLDALNVHGKVLAHAKRTVSGFTGGSRHGVPTVVLKPGKYASADVEWLNFNPKTSGDCVFSHSVAATPANTGATVHVKRQVSICDLQVHPTVAGVTGSN